MKPSIPKGTRDFSPLEMARRNYILDTIKTVYQRYGFQQIETPTMENLSTLEGKYGEEGDKLLFRILNSGPVVEEIKSKQSEIRISDIAEKGLRYDLTVPFARYVVMHQNEITFPFKRYQIQPVWRADRPQKGRYREFVQCDADVIGSTSLLNEVELLQIMIEVFSKLGISVTIKVNSRKILQALIEEIGASDKFIEITSAIDKIDKIGVNQVIDELRLKNISEFSLEQLKTIFLINENLKLHHDGFWTIEEYFTFEERINDLGISGLNEIKYIYESLKESGFDTNSFKLDLTLARGLSYYTGTIFEVKVNDSRSTFTSSILGGGRYDDLTGIFGLPNVSGVGISFGVDRIYDVMEEMKLFDQLNLQSASTQILFANFGKEEERHCLKLVSQVRDAGINAEIYPEAAKMKKQMSYADDKKIPYVVLVGSEEIKSGMLTVKNMKSGEQEKITIKNLISKIIPQ